MTGDVPVTNESGQVIGRVLSWGPDDDFGLRCTFKLDPTMVRHWTKGFGVMEPEELAAVIPLGLDGAPDPIRYRAAPEEPPQRPQGPTPLSDDCGCDYAVGHQCDEHRCVLGVRVHLAGTCCGDPEACTGALRAFEDEAHTYEMQPGDHGYP